MRTKLTGALALCLAFGILASALPTMAAAPALTFSSHSAYIRYHSDPTLLGPGVHTQMWIRYERYPDSVIIQVSGDGWDIGQGGSMLSSWAWAYEKVYPADALVGGVTPDLAEAWVSSGALDFQCFTPGTCPPMPAQLVVSAYWTATGPMMVDARRDTTGTPTLQWVRRWRDASADVEFSYPSADGPLPVPALRVSTDINWYHQNPIGAKP